MKKRTKQNGLAIVPEKSRIVDLSDGKSTNEAVISDHKGELAPILVKCEKSLKYLTAEEEEEIVQKAILGMPEYQAALDQELPYPTSDASEDEWMKWMRSRRLNLYPCEMFAGDKEAERLIREMKNSRE